MMPREIPVKNTLHRLSGLECYLGYVPVPYREFEAGDRTYYFAPGAFLYREVTGTAAVSANLPTRCGTKGRTEGSAIFSERGGAGVPSCRRSGGTRCWVASGQLALTARDCLLPPR